MKKLLIVTNDNIESRLILNDYILNNYFRNKEIDVMTKADRLFYEKEIKPLRDDIKYLDDYVTSNKVKLFIYKVCIFFSHLSNINNSISSFQKIFILSGLPTKIVLSKIFYSKIKYILPLLEFIGSLFNFRYLDIFKKNSGQEYDYILFSRPDDLLNLEIFNKYGGKRTQIITLIRNFDTPTLKRIFVVQSTYSLVYESKLNKLIKKQKNVKDYGKIIDINYFLDEISLKKSVEKKYILFATSQEEFVTGNYKQIDIINYIAQKIEGKNIQLIARVHPNHKNQYKELDENTSIILQNEIYTIFKSKNGGNLELQTKENQYNYIETLQKSYCVFTFGSTIVYDAIKLRIPSYFINLDSNSMLYEREHLKLLSSIGVEVLTTINEIDNAISKQCNF